MNNLLDAVNAYGYNSEWYSGTANWNDSITIGLWPVMYSKTDTVFAPMTFDGFDDTQWYHVAKNKSMERALWADQLIR